MTNRRTFLMGASALGVAIATPSAFAPPPALKNHISPQALKVQASLPTI